MSNNESLDDLADLFVERMVQEFMKRVRLPNELETLSKALVLHGALTLAALSDAKSVSIDLRRLADDIEKGAAQGHFRIPATH